MLSRAYLKMQEAILWSRFPLLPGQVCVEIGAAPGGACQAPLEHGLKVIAVDPAELDPSLLSHPDLMYIRARSREVRRRRLQSADWLMADLNVAPNYTLDAVADIVSHSEMSITGMILTFKLMTWDLAAHVPDYIARIKELGFHYVRTRQLAHNRREFCLAALRDKTLRIE